jgi:hypothetical protein
VPSTYRSPRILTAVPPIEISAGLLIKASSIIISPAPIPPAAVRLPPILIFEVASIPP